jgi:hypothetical protein
MKKVIYYLAIVGAIEEMPYLQYNWQLSCYYKRLIQ